MAELHITGAAASGDGTSRTGAARVNRNVDISVFSDVDTHSKALRGWNQNYVQLSAGRFIGTLQEIRVNSLTLFRETTSQVVHQQGQLSGRRRTICIPIYMLGGCHFNGLGWSINQYASLHGNTEFDLVTGKSLDLISISADADSFAYASNNDSDEIKSSVITPNPKGAAMLRSILCMVFDGRQPWHQLASKTHDVEDAIYEALADSLEGAAQTKGAQPTFSLRRRIVRNAIDVVRSDPYGNVTVSDLCKQLRVNRRSLQEYFHDVVEISPKQYLLAYRLNQVRSVILESDASTSVGDAAMRWGFWHLSDFAKVYRRLFQELPSSTAEFRRSTVSLKAGSA
jgi:AraC family ethanolamine operon transcriptional activator